MLTKKSPSLTLSILGLASLLVPVQLMVIKNASATVANVAVDNTVTDKRKEKTSADIQAMAQKKDPTRPPSVIVQQLAQEVAVKPEFELTAIFTRNDQQYAVVNGAVLKTGDAFANMLVAEITTTQLVLEDAQTAQEVKVLELHGAINVKKQVVK